MQYLKGFVQRARCATAQLAHPFVRAMWRLVLACLALSAPQAWAVNYTFPGTMPVGCSATSGTSGAYTCGTVNLAAGDSITINAPKPATITFTALSTNNAQINVAGLASDLTLVVNGTLSASAGAHIKANVSAVRVSSSGAVTYGGDITTTSDYISLGAGTRVTGTLTTTTGPITLLTGTSSNYTTVGAINSGGTVTLNAYNSVNGATVGYLVSAAGHNTFGGSITSTTTYVSLGGNAVVNGAIYAADYVDTGSNSRITGSITSATSYIDTGLNVNVGGGLSAGGTYVDIHSGAVIGGSIKAKTYVSMTTGSSVAGNVTAQTTVAVGSGSSVARCVRSNGASAIVLHSAASVTGACCGTGSTCTNTCVSATPKPPACSWPTSGLMAEYRFEEFNYTGSEAEVVDSSGSGWHGKMLGAVSSTADGKVCRGMLVPRNTSAVVAALNTGVDVNTLGNSGTVAFWYKSITSGNEHRMLFDGTLVSGGKFYLYRDDEGSGVDLNFHLTDGNDTVRNVDKLNTLSDESWGHVAVTWRFATGSSASRLRLYVNGVEQDAQTFTVTSGAIKDLISTLYFGDNRSGVATEINSANGYLDEIRLYDGELTATEVAEVMAQTRTCTNAPHHIEVTSASASGVTCMPHTFTIKACANADCSTPYAGALNGNLILNGTPTVNYTQAFSIPAGSPTGTTTVTAHVTTAGTVTASLGGLSVMPSAGAAPYCGMGEAAGSGKNCAYTAATSGLLFNVPDHVADAVQSVTLSAVNATDNGLVCTPAFANVDKSINFQCAHSNPNDGSRAVRVADATYGSYGALNASGVATAKCDVGGRNITMKFNGSGVATANVAYADVGLMSLTATYTGTAGGETGLLMTGSDTFIAAPASFSIAGWPSGTIKAGASFDATVTALNSSGAVTPNFGRESPAPESATVRFTRYRPTFTGVSDGSFSGSLGAFSNGAATGSLPNKFAWSEVGTGDLRADLASGAYLGASLSASGSTGSTGAVGPFIAHHFDVTAPHACGSFTYSGQAIGTALSPLKITARNASGGMTINHDGSNASAALNYAKAVTLTDATGAALGGWGGTNAVPASAFVRGEARVSTAAFTFSNKLTVPTAISVRATEDAGGNGVSSVGYQEDSVILRSGRLKVSNKFGSEKSSLQVNVQTQYWDSKGWLLNSADSCTSVPAASVVRARYLDHKGAATTAWSSSPSAISISGGRGILLWSAPTPEATGTLDFAINLGSSGTDQSCLATHPPSTGANLGWLRSQNGSANACASVTTYDRDPSARATFGIYSPESSKVIHTRDLF